jgi:hypothetical protein
MKYEVMKLAMLREIMPFSAIALPRIVSESSTVIEMVMRRDQTGSFIRKWTFMTMPAPGMPRSRVKAQSSAAMMVVIGNACVMRMIAWSTRSQFTKLTDLQKGIGDIPTNPFRPRRSQWLG